MIPRHWQSRLAVLGVFGCALVLGGLSGGCTVQKTHPAAASALTATTGTTERAVLSRADPGHIFWLERQSILGAATTLAHVVSGSPLIWREAPAVSRPELLLQGSAMWFTVSPQTLITQNKRTFIQELETPEIRALLGSLGFSGLFLEHLEESGRAWVPQRDALIPDSDATSLQLAGDVGSDEDLSRLMQLYLAQNIQLGSDAPGLATGYGPDFMLAASALRDWPGAYMMVNIPRELWPSLPTPASETTGTALNSAQVAELVNHHILPQKLVRETLPWASLTGWAVTGEVRGHDGETRRWVYRYHLRPDRPLLQWDDPSHAAKRMLSAAIIQQTGLRRLPLVALHTEALLGQERATASATPPPTDPALLQLAEEIRRYGGWSLSGDLLPVGMVLGNNGTGPDFARDTITFPFAEYALLTGDTRPLAASLDTALADGVDQRRLWRTLSSELSMNFTPLLKGRTVPVFATLPTTLQATVPALAALRLGVHEMEKTPTPGATLGTPDEDVKKHIQGMHTLMALLRGSMPGLLSVSGQDIAGTLSLWQKEQQEQTIPPVFPAWGLGINPSSSRGVARGMTAYPPLMIQQAQPTIFTQTLRNLATWRTTYRFAEGVVRARLATKNLGVVAWLTSLPDNNMLLTVANFSGTLQHETLTLPASMPADTYELTENQPVALAGNVLSLNLEPFQCQLVLFHNGTLPTL